ncbi:ATP phosphoribosyltransferase [Megasphaera sp. AM44-1BH]|jgi:ATP phosphoribosyltransferase|uniref:ATP phosphoribosyltransferase n=1 Tax=Megasphaera sp. AM44-1BH TaxID=2292358 RepID=UPI000E4A07F0|nr:ATP phosphoribosyltransferase [Megasphaera sp. AM44-1BH]RHA15850.1 ATP phosphoribosyltransferase [Megasphaera sp. AM44-1BH]
MSIHIALAKGRIHKVVMKYLMESGYEFPAYSEDSRKLIFEDAGHTLKLTLVKSPDVAVYVERGAADIGIVGEDVLIEDNAGANVYEVLDIGIGRCNMAVAGVKGKKVDMSRRITVGTKYPRIARKYFEENHHSVDIIKLNGSVELAPLVGLSDVIVDIVETGNTLRANGLEVLDYFMDFSARMICNPVSFKMKYDEIHTLIDVIKKKEIR